jgi:4-hydroxy-tetrahydrodipicolinate synthase
MQIVLGEKPKDFAILSGDDNLTLPMLALGMDGLISVVANAYPSDYSDMVRAGLAGNFEEARPLHYKYVDLVNLLFADGNPAGVKKVLNLLGICSQDIRQ